MLVLRLPVPGKGAGTATDTQIPVQMLFARCKFAVIFEYNLLF